MHHYSGKVQESPPFAHTYFLLSQSFCPSSYKVAIVEHLDELSKASGSHFLFQTWPVLPSF